MPQHKLQLSLLDTPGDATFNGTEDAKPTTGHVCVRWELICLYAQVLQQLSSVHVIVHNMIYVHKLKNI